MVPNCSSLLHRHTSVGRRLRLRAPTADQSFLLRPDDVSFADLAHANQCSLQHAPVRIGGHSLADFRSQVRTTCLQAAQDWMQQTLRLPVEASATGLLYVTGHQPSLNHIGVWAKNLAVSEMARQAGGIGLNLVVDNDLCGPPVVKYPTGSHEAPHWGQLEFDAPGPVQPWEERSLQNAEIFSSFAGRVATALRPWGIVPAVETSWGAARELSRHTSSLTALLTRHRIEMERQLSSGNLELPVSRMCQTGPFLAFVLHIAQQAPDFFEHYNAAVRQYRHLARVRNHRHPVPDLEHQGDQLELPFWYWPTGSSDRQRLFVARQKDQIHLLADGKCVAILPATGNDIEPLRKLQMAGRLRTRALTTTLFARLCLADLFTHGIGGAQYDQITDLLMQNWLKIQPPVFQTLTATFRLPLNPFDVFPEEIQQLRQKIRRVQFHGSEAHLPEVRALQAEHDRLLQEARADRDPSASRAWRRAGQSRRRIRHQRLRAIQQQLASRAQEHLEHLQEELALALSQEQANLVLNSREYAACLFPESQLQTAVESLNSILAQQAVIPRRTAIAAENAT